MRKIVCVGATAVQYGAAAQNTNIHVGNLDEEKNNILGDVRRLQGVYVLTRP